MGDLGSLRDRASRLGVQPLTTMGSMRLRNYVASGATVLFIDIKGFTAGCARMSAAEVGEWVADFYERVDAAAAAHGVRKAEVRGDCCVCVAGTAAAVPWAELAGAARGAAAEAAVTDGREDQVTRMLAFAADLHAVLAASALAGGPATSVRMGVATGDVALLVGNGGAAGRGGFVSVQGDTVRLASRMEALSEAGTVLAHRSAVDKWLAEGAGRSGPAGAASRVAPAMVQVECPCRGPQDAAAYDCACRAFRRPRPALPAAPRLAAAAGDGPDTVSLPASPAGARDAAPTLPLSAVEPAPKRLARSRSFS